MSSNYMDSMRPNMEEGTQFNPLHEDTSYNNGTVISYPPAAAASFSQSPQCSHLKFQPPPKLAPPHSPLQNPTSLSQSSFKVSPGLLTRATSVISKRQSASSSPTRPHGHHRTLSTSYPPQAAATASTTSLDTQRRRKGAKSTAFAEFFSGSSELVSSFAVPPLKRSENSPTRVLSSHIQLPQQQQGVSSHARSIAGSTFSSAAASLFTRPGRSTSPTKGFSRSRIPIAEDECEEEDEILNLNLEDELFPGGDAEPLGGSAEAFDTLFANAERLFMRIQIAYQEKHSALAKARAQQRAEREEWDEARERNEHLKSQLDAMGCKVREQEQMMEELAHELKNEKESRRKEADRRVRSVRAVGADDRDEPRGRRSESAGRSSLDTTGDGSDGGMIWSRSGSPSLASISTMPDEIEISGFAPGDFGGGLREENMRLKARVTELEETVDGCLGLVHGV